MRKIAPIAGFLLLTMLLSGCLFAARQKARVPYNAVAITGKTSPALLGQLQFDILTYIDVKVAISPKDADLIIEVLDDAPDPCAAVSIKFLALCCPVRPRPKTSLPLDPHLLYNSSPCRSWAAAKLLSYSLLEAKFTTKICGAYGCAAPRGISHWVHPGPPRPCAAWTKPTLPLPAESAVQIMIMITKRSNPTQRASSTTRLRASTSLISMSI